MACSLQQCNVNAPTSFFFFKKIDRVQLALLNIIHKGIRGNLKSKKPYLAKTALKNQTHPTLESEKKQ